MSDGASEPWSIDSIFQGIVDFLKDDIWGNIVKIYDSMISSPEDQLIWGAIITAIPYIVEFSQAIIYLSA